MTWGISIKIFAFSLLMLCGFSQAFADNMFANNEVLDPFQFKLPWDPTLLFFVFLAIMYAYGIHKFGKRKVMARWQIVLFYLGVSINCLALLPPVDPLSDRLFFMHMIQHQMFSSIGIPLMLFGAPFYVALRGAPRWVLRSVYKPILRTRVLTLGFEMLTKPIVALVFYQTMLFFWHVPLFYNLALFHDGFHLIEHACFAISSMFLWRNIVTPHPMRSPLPLPARMLYLAVIEASNIGLSAWLTFSRKVYYGYEGIPQPSWWTYGYLADQQLGGLIMWIPGGAVNYMAMTVCFFVWASKQQNRPLVPGKV